MRWKRVLVTGALSLTVVGAWVGCAEWPVETPAAKVDGNEGPIQLEDGRRVSVRYTDQGLAERHQEARGRPWSRPRVLDSKGGDPECRVELSAYRNTVAVVAHYYPGCYADSEPKTVIVAVSDGDLDEWDTHRGEGYLMWKWTRFPWSGQRVVFRVEDSDGLHELSWRQTIGFTGPATSPPEGQEW
jgi:hypothetical protein